MPEEWSPAANINKLTLEQSIAVDWARTTAVSRKHDYDNPPETDVTT